MPGRSRVPLRRYPARRIALIKPSALGDIVHSLPVLSALRFRYPEGHISWIINRAYEPLLHDHPDLDATLPFDRGAARSDLARAAASYAQFLKRVREQRFDLVVDLQGLFRSGVMAVASGAPRRVGLSSAREGARWFYTDILPVADFDAVHAVDRYWLVSEALGVGDLSKRFHVPIAEAERRWVFDTLQQNPRPWLVLAVGSRWLTKRWPPEHFATLVERATQRHGGTAIFVGSGDEVHLSQETAGFVTAPVRDFTGRTTLPRLAAVLSLADVVIGNDTGPLHLAAALGRPVVAPYTCTKVRLNGPYGAERGAVESRVWCQGSYLTRCSRLECMTELTPDRLWPILQGILQTWECNRRSA